MEVNEILRLASDLIAIPSLSGEEGPVFKFLESWCLQRDWSGERLAESGNSFQLLVPFGTPEIIFTTHLDIVSAGAEAFRPRIDNDRLYGRGACDAKGIAAAMIGCAARLLDAGSRDFGLLFVTGEELDGSGARAASGALTERGVRFVINGEPTENTVVTGHKGGLELAFTTTGVSAHSGYPEMGVDANRKLIEILQQIMMEDWGSDPELGIATVNIGKLDADNAANVISPAASARCLIRTVGDNSALISRAKEISAGRAEVEVIYDCPVARMLGVPGLPSTVAAYCTDIPNFTMPGIESVLYGPGSILQAHVRDEFLEIASLQRALLDYLTIFSYLKGLLK